MDIPIEIFLSFIVLSLAMGIIGLLKQIPLLLFISGAMITFWAIITDNIIMGREVIESSFINNTSTYSYELSLFEFTQYPKILFGLLGSVIMISGALIWKSIET